MRTNRKHRHMAASSVSATVGLLLTAVTASPAHADESIRGRQWHLDAMHAEEMWKTSTGKGVTVAVIDSGVSDSITDLQGQVLDGKDYSAKSGDEHKDHEGHGTSMAALIAATGARGELNGSYGLAPGVKILPIRMRYSTEDGSEVDSKAEYSRVMTRAIRYAADSQAQIINISMGSSNAPGRKNVSTPALASVVKYALGKGKLIFAAVGNSGDKSNFPEYPAATPGVVGVGAINQNVKYLKSSQWGPQVDVVAPGKDMISACSKGTQICKGDGTSGATALASASAALIWSRHPSWTNNQVLRVLINTMQGNKDSWTRDDSVGYGAVRPRIALKEPGAPGPANEYPLPDLAAAAKTPSSKEPQPSHTRENNSGTEPVNTASVDKNSHLIPWLSLGLGAAAIIGGTITVWVVRSRRGAPSPVPD
ncbi:type VII secretion-associated serine protease mycosin [Streptomyces sp. Je 1-332]|uniref:type VII secretion-associated serine protease mycosin n=1 Tax=Streptomyces sp. Je 1-332 TaxID=3231270 RepID=UPI00345B00E4